MGNQLQRITIGTSLDIFMDQNYCYIFFSSSLTAAVVIQLLNTVLRLPACGRTMIAPVNHELDRMYVRMSHLHPKSTEEATDRW